MSHQRAKGARRGYQARSQVLGRVTGVRIFDIAWDRRPGKKVQILSFLNEGELSQGLENYARFTRA